MSYNGYGQYSLPAGNPVVTGTVISSSWANTTMSNLAAALSMAVVKDGQQTITGDIPFSGFKATGLGIATTSGDATVYQQVLGVSSSVASAATLNLTTTTGTLAHVTGTTTITAVTMTAGTTKTLIFDGILTLTHSATANNLPQGSNITTAAGDRALYWSDGTVVYCVFYSSVSGASAINWLPTGANATSRTVTSGLNDFIRWKNTGAVLDATTNNATALQNLITDVSAMGGPNFYGAEIHCEPSGTAAISSGLTVAQNKHVSFVGGGRTSSLLWTGGNTAAMLYYLGGNAGPDCQVHIEKLGFLCSNGATGLTAIKNGDSSVSYGCTNFSVYDCMFQGVDTCLETHKETDEVTFQKNWTLSYDSYGVYAVGNGTNSGYLIDDNHFQGGAAGSWAVRHTGGSNVVITKNEIQSGSAIKGIWLNSVNGFTITGNRFESQAAFGHGPFLQLESCATGVVEQNITTGDTGASIITVDGACSNIRFGPQAHGVSGGTPTTFIVVSAGATDIWIYGKQVGATNPYSGTPSVYAAGAYEVANVPVSQYNGFVNSVASGTPVSLFTVAANTFYLVTAKESTDGYEYAAIVSRSGSAAMTITRITAANALFVLSASGNTLQVTQSSGSAIRTIEYSAFILS